MIHSEVIDFLYDRVWDTLINIPGDDAQELAIDVDTFATKLADLNNENR